MRKLVIAILLVMVSAGAGFARGNSEKLTTVEGTVILVEEENSLVRLTLRTQDREQIIVEVPAGEIERLRVRVEARIQVEGVYIGVPKGQLVRARILARVVSTGGTDVVVEVPVQLTTRDRLQIRTWEQEQAMDQTRTQAHDGTGTGDRPTQQQTGKQ